MANNDRRLMPYEHQLVEALGITKDEYLDFVAQQQLYNDPKQGTILDARNEVASAIALVLTIVGTILQVVAALIAEKPKSQGRTQTRDDVFAPRSGFNSLQELGNYGDPVNLIYTDTDTNPNGGVRVATSLLWSAVKSYGSSQYVKLLLLVGGGGIGFIDAKRTAFGQTSIQNLIAQKYWLYFNYNDTGPLRPIDLIDGSRDQRDPGVNSADTQNIYRIGTEIDARREDGFSHAISPSTSNRFGVYSPVPVSVSLESRFRSGNITIANNEIKAYRLNDIWGENNRDAINRPIPQNTRLLITLARTNANYDRLADEEAAEFRRAVSSAFDNASTMKLGSAKFIIESISNGSTDDGDISVELICTEAGHAPSVPYSKRRPDGSEQPGPEGQGGGTSGNAEYDRLRKDVERLLNEDQRDSEITNAKQLLDDGRIYKIDKRVFDGAVGVRNRITYTYKFVRNLSKSEKDVLRRFIQFGPLPNQFQRDTPSQFSQAPRPDATFFTKALVKVETAKYETLSACHIIDFAIKARVWRRISGRQEAYGSNEREGYPSTDNGIKNRTAMFLLKYRRRGGATFSYVPGIFVIRRASDVDHFVSLQFDSGDSGLESASYWQFEMEPIHDPIAEFLSHPLNVGAGFNFFYIENSGPRQRIGLPGTRAIFFRGRTRQSSTRLPPLNRSPRKTNEWDLFSHTADTQLQMSFDQGPEFEISAVTEQIVERFSRFESLYSGLSLVGFNMYSGRNVQDLRSISVFVTKGRRTKLLRTSGNGWGLPGFSYIPDTANGYANRAPDIFFDTIDDKRDGIGKYVDNFFAIDVEQLARSKKFCEANGLFMDGMIADFVSWRQFWADTAPFSLLELTKQDGKECLIPAVPYDRNTGAIIRQISITSLFNTGNILEGSYKEEFIDYGASTEDVIITAIYRDNERDGVFPRNNSVEVKLADTSEESAIRQTIDMSAFVTRRQQAILVAKFLCQTRRHSRRSIEFKTFPTDSFVAPGSYIYVELAQNQWNQIYTGIIEDDGRLSMPLGDSILDGTYQFLIYNPQNIGAKAIYKENVTVANGRAAALRNFSNHVFVLGKAVKNKRVFRVVEVSMDEEGEVGIKGIEHPCDKQGRSLISNGLAQVVPGLFMVDGNRET